MKATIWILLLCHTIVTANDHSNDRLLASIDEYFFTRHRSYVRTRDDNLIRRKPRYDVTIRRHSKPSSSKGCRSGKAGKKKQKTTFLDAVDSLITDDNELCSSSKGKGKKKKQGSTKKTKKEKCKSSRGKGQKKKSSGSGSSSSSSLSSKKGYSRSKYCEPTRSTAPVPTAAPMATSTPVATTAIPVVTNAPIMATNVPITFAPTARTPEPIIPTLQPTIDTTPIPTELPTTIPITTMPLTNSPTSALTTLAPTVAPSTRLETPAPTSVPATSNPTSTLMETLAPTLVSTTSNPTIVPTTSPTPLFTTSSPTTSPTSMEPTMAPSPSSNTIAPSVDSNVSPFRLDYFVNDANPADYDQIQQTTRDYLDQFLQDQFMFSFVFMYDGLTMVASNTMGDPGVFMANFENVQVMFSSSMQPTQSDLDVLIASAFATPAVLDLLGDLQSSGTSFESTTDVGYVRL